jgi:hypothetical protein
MSVQRPGPNTTAVVIAGASDWPFTTQFGSSPQFKNSAAEFRKFLLEQDGFKLPEDNLLDLFDTDEEQSVVVRKIANFLLGRQAALKSAGLKLSDVIFYYVGHGGFDTGGGSAYFLALRQTNSIDYLASSLAISSLRRALRENTRDVRHYLILDCCFAAAALAPYLQLSAAAQGLVTQIQDAFPPAGTALLCASGAVVPAKAKRGAKFTMFSEALFDVLRSGVADAPESLSLGETGIAVRSLLKTRYGDEAVRPEVHSPEQSQGSVADVPIFQNAFKRFQQQEPLLLKDENDNVAKGPDSNLDGLFKEFDEIDIPARVGSSIINENEWRQIPRRVQAMLKQLEQLYRPRLRLQMQLMLAFAFVCMPLFLVAVYVDKHTKLEAELAANATGLFTVAGISAAMLILLIALFILFKGEKKVDGSVLRKIGKDSYPWEHFDVMQMLRRPRNIINYRGQLFDQNDLTRVMLTAGAVLFSDFVFFLLAKYFKL